jgi:tRNA G10  N-methylase Trm11
MTGTEADIPTDEWHGAYEGGWQGLIVPEAFSHPAKFSYSLTERIFGHAYAKEWVKKGDVVADPFGGVGCGGIVAAYSDIQWVGVELEARFCKLAQENFELHRRKWEKLNSPMPVIVQGDSRQLAAKIGTVECVVSSPPYSGDIGIGNNQRGFRPNDGRPNPRFNRDLTQEEKRDIGYGNTPGNLGNLKPGDVDCVVSSPPYEGSVSSEHCGIDFSKMKRDGDTRHQSPNAQGKVPFQYGKDEANIGNDSGPTFWQAAKEIVQQCHQILKPGGHAIFVLKAFVRKGEIVDFPGDWRRLCESVGFETVCVHPSRRYVCITPCWLRRPIITGYSARSKRRPSARVSFGDWPSRRAHRR